MHFSERWGYLSRAGLNDKSQFTRQIEKYADIYTSRVSNFLRYTVSDWRDSPLDATDLTAAASLTAHAYSLSSVFYVCHDFPTCTCRATCTSGRQARHWRMTAAPAAHPARHRRPPPSRWPLPMATPPPMASQCRTHDGGAHHALGNVLPNCLCCHWLLSAWPSFGRLWVYDS